ncbi:MAG: putative metal-binding motif-containing protein [Sandaracinaceae bacterium]|nr:putative metal-binding motif-containing protein [Sandaracinaceae bacterium]
MGTAEICDGLDNDCDGMVNNGGNALCSVDNANELCSGAPASCSISSCTGGYVNADGGVHQRLRVSARGLERQ